MSAAAGHCIALIMPGRGVAARCAESFHIGWAAATHLFSPWRLRFRAEAALLGFLMPLPRRSVSFLLATACVCLCTTQSHGDSHTLSLDMNNPLTPNNRGASDSALIFEHFVRRQPGTIFISSYLALRQPLPLLCCTDALAVILWRHHRQGNCTRLHP